MTYRDSRDLGRQGEKKKDQTAAQKKIAKSKICPLYQTEQQEKTIMYMDLTIKSLRAFNFIITAVTIMYISAANNSFKPNWYA